VSRRHREGAEEREQRAHSERCRSLTSHPRRRKHNDTCSRRCLLLRLLGGLLLGRGLLLGGLLLGRLLGLGLLGLLGLGLLGLLGLGLLLLGGGLLLGLLGRLLQGLTELVAGLDLEKLAGLDEVLELGGQNLLEVAGKLEVGAEVLGDGGDGRAVPVLEGQDGGLHHVLVLGVGGGGFRGHLCLLVCCRRRTVEWTSRAINPIKIKFEKKHIAQS
jgi:hypothetical protein